MRFNADKRMNYVVYRFDPIALKWLKEISACSSLDVAKKQLAAFVKDNKNYFGIQWMIVEEETTARPVERLKYDLTAELLGVDV